MADMIMELRIMPEDGEVDYDVLEAKVKETVLAYGKGITIKECGSESMSFGLQAVKIKFQMDENYGSDNLEENLSNIEEAGEVAVTLMDRL